MPRGGMSKNPFAGNSSMNNLDDEFMASLFKGELTVDQALALRIIKMSVRDYLYFGLGKNGITPEKFLEAFEYLFQHKSQFVAIEVRSKCFDVHYSLSGISTKFSISAFLDRLRAKRRSVLKANEKQVLTYMAKYRQQEWRTLSTGERKGKHAFAGEGALRTLEYPESSKALAMLYLFGRVVPPPTFTVPQSRSLKYKNLLF